MVHISKLHGSNCNMIVHGLAGLLTLVNQDDDITALQVHLTFKFILNVPLKSECSLPLMRCLTCLEFVHVL